MRRIAASALLVALVGAAGAQASTAPSLRLVATDPIRVDGRHFRALEPVRLTASIGAVKTVVRVRASSTGRFAATFRGRASVGPCSAGLTVVAVGARGSRAVLRLPQTACPPD